MLWKLNKSTSHTKLLASLTERELRLFVVETQNNKITVKTSVSKHYDSEQALEDIFLSWCVENKLKDIECHWLLSRKLYQTYSVKSPSVPGSELNASIKWLVKDQIEQPLNEILASHYLPFNPEGTTSVLTAVVVDKSKVECLINLAERAGLNLKTIEIIELSAADILADEIDNEKIIGLIEEDEQGLIYNFYRNASLALTRHIKGRFIPAQKDSLFSLETDSSQVLTDQFLLETQRTLDYCVSQVFRQPIDSLLIDSRKGVSNSLIELIEKVTEVTVKPFESSILSKTEEEVSLTLSLAEAGVIYSANKKNKPLVNFYFKNYHPKPLEFGFKFSAGIAAVFLVFLSIYGISQEQQKSQLENQLLISKQKLDSLQASMIKLQSNRNKETHKKNIEQQILRKQTELLANQKLLRHVSTKTSKETTLYSHILSALSKQQVESLWLTNINLQPSVISLKGITSHIESIPNYINKMNKNAVLNRQFVDLKIKRDEINSSLINFEIIDGRYLDAN